MLRRAFDLLRHKNGNRQQNVKNSLAPKSSVPTLEPWRLSIYGSFIKKGAPIAYIRPLTIQGRHWLWNHVNYPYIGSNAVVGAEQLLALIQRMDTGELKIHWQS
jgi:hypothetical protein